MSATEISSASDNAVRGAIEMMKSLRDGEAGVIKAVSCGRCAIPALCALLFTREPSGIYQPRCWAVHALSMLGAYDVLFDFLAGTKDARDAIERAGDDAVINAAARYLSARRDEETFQLLLILSRRRYWPGVVAALGSFHRIEAIPHLVGALAEDDCRLMAEPTLAAFGSVAQPALMSAATTPASASANESETSIRKRARALALLRDIGIAKGQWACLRSLLEDPSPRIALLACDICLLSAPQAEWQSAVARLMALLNDADWMLEIEIEECLMHHYRKISRLISKMLSGRDAGDLSLRAEGPLLRIRARLEHLQRGAHRCRGA